MKIKPIVEGFGDVLAVPELLRRIQFEYGLGGHEVQIARPIKWNRSHFNSEAQVRTAVRLAVAETDCVGVLIVFDSDDDCPKTYASRIAKWSIEEARTIPCEIVMADREFEAWFLAAMESLRGRNGISPDAVSEDNPERIRGAKERLESKMIWNVSYSETSDQVALTSRLNLRTVHDRCRSFRKLVKAFRQLLISAGAQVNEWAAN
jgi:hypothetical protein